MLSVGVRELKQQASKLLRLVRDQGETIEITYHGKTIARLVPALSQAEMDQDLAAWWSSIDELTAEISAHWPENVSAVEAVREGRREL
ncbi:MAG: type II toxin-antitoxin system prevent-host-death family antitoxin [Candidatus Promineifilaceae bacterium]|nr:type II toxin-antitoxin system prevent-host-death family antitoxin [Candidatus Promineifilaceae bacterium]